MNNLILPLLLVLTIAVYGQDQNRPPRPSRVPAAPYPIEHVQPNGDTLTIRLVGDEHWHCTITTDCYVIAQNKRGYYCYAREIGDRQYEATRRRAHNQDARTKSEIRWLNRKGVRIEN